MLNNDKSTIIENFGRHVSAGKVKFFQQFGLEFVPGKRKGCYLYDLEGKAFLNAIVMVAFLTWGIAIPKSLLRPEWRWKCGILGIII